ncbi:MAG TPA: YihY/virulence factor BrkB family protein, partial [Chthoniobacteraceae bacterium]|nr:YihY/virulence factor BrkB family protein [Chthoniobacteraceae bacterium]
MSAKPPSKVISFLDIAWRIIWGTLKKYIETDGEQRAASFAYYALFALFPLIVLFVTIGSQFVDKEQAANKIVTYFNQNIMPMDEGGREDMVTDAVTDVINSRRPAGIFAVVAVVWSSLGFFHALVRGVNRAWGTYEYPWYRLPFKNLVMVGIVASVLFIGIIVPAIIQGIETYVWTHKSTEGLGTLVRTFGIYARLLLPSLVMFYGFTMFYKFAPRKHPQFGEVWLAALVVALSLQWLRNVFVVYAQNVRHFKSV